MAKTEAEHAREARIETTHYRARVAAETAVRTLLVNPPPLDPREIGVLKTATETLQDYLTELRQR